MSGRQGRQGRRGWGEGETRGLGQVQGCWGGELGGGGDLRAEERWGVEGTGGGGVLGLSGEAGLWVLWEHKAIFLPQTPFLGL